MVCITEAKEIFKKAYGADATHLFSAAGRINVIGEHVDYCGGKVLPAALNLSCKVYARKNGERVIRILLKGIEGVITLELDKLDSYKTLKYGNYQAGVAYLLSQKGVALAGCDLYYSGFFSGSAGFSLRFSGRLPFSLFFSSFMRLASYCSRLCFLPLGRG